MRAMSAETRIGKRLAAIREHRRISQAELAAALGVSKAAIGHYEHGRVRLTVPRLEQLARALHCRVADLLAPLDTPVLLGDVTGLTTAAVRAGMFTMEHVAQQRTAGGVASRDRLGPGTSRRMVIFVTEPVAPLTFDVGRRTTAMTYYELVDLARLCAYNSRITTDREVARVLWQMANEYQAKAAEFTARR